MFTVDIESAFGAKRVRNEEIAEHARANSDIMIAFASIDPHKGKMGAREARDLIANYPIRGFKFHRTDAGLSPGGPRWPIRSTR